MRSLFLQKCISIALGLALFLSMAVTNVVYANDETNFQQETGPIVIRQGGPVVDRVPAIPVGNNLLASLATVYRAGWTDATYVYYPTPLPAKWEHNGSHNSQSDLNEDDIWADGTLKVGTAGVVDSCANHTVGYNAHCFTSKTYQWKYTFTAKSWSFFHETGYGDQTLITEKTLNP